MGETRSGTRSVDASLQTAHGGVGEECRPPGKLSEEFRFRSKERENVDRALVHDRKGERV